MKKNLVLVIFVVLVLSLTACSTNENANDAGPAEVQTLLVADKSFSAADLDTMPHVEAVFNDVTYTGVPVTDLLSAAGYDLASLSAVKAIAADGYSVNYDSKQLSPENVIVAYAAANESMTEEDGPFRLVLPGEEGKLNLRMLVEIKVVP